jgi:hypothetical protein
MTVAAGSGFNGVSQNPTARADMPEKQVEQQPPEVLAVILADGILRDMVSGKFIIHGTFSVITAPAFPWGQPVIALYISMTNGHGQTPIKIRLIDVDEERPPLVEAESVIDFPDPISVVEFVIALGNVVFPMPGEYRVQLFGAGAPLREHRLRVMLPQAPRPPQLPKA